MSWVKVMEGGGKGVRGGIEEEWCKGSGVVVLGGGGNKGGDGVGVGRMVREDGYDVSV